MKAGEVAELIRAHVDEVKIVNERRVFAKTDAERCRRILIDLKERDLRHLSTISGVDRGEVIAIVYHIDCRPAMLSLEIELPKGAPRVQTVTDLFPGAVLYERELIEMFGVEVQGHPDPRRLFLPDDWPTGKYPLRREVM